MDSFVWGIWNWLLHATLGFIPAWVWIIVAGLLLGWAWKAFSWQGLLGAALAVLTIGAYRQGWRARDAEGTEHLDPDSPDARPSIFTRKPKKPAAPSTNRPGTFNRDTGTWNE